jgi:hypothetical protein
LLETVFLPAVLEAAAFFVECEGAVVAAPGSWEA